MMKCIDKLLLSWFILLNTVVFAQKNITFNGQITCGKEKLANVFVTDGENYTLTDNHGRYTLQSSSNKEFIYYTSPKNYSPQLINGLPIFYQKLGSDLTYNFNLDKAPDQNKHTFLVWADPQVIELAELDQLKKVADDFKETANAYAAKMPVHAISLGDMVFDRHVLFDPYKAIIADVNLPFYHVIGNHDMDYSNLTHETSSKTYGQHFGPAYYSYNKGEVHYVVLNDVFYYGYQYHYMGYIDQKQLDWLAADLQQVAKGSTVVLSLHIPTKYHDAEPHPSLMSLQKNTLINNTALYKLLANYNTHILAGHSHTQWNTIISENILEHTHVAACGAWWQGDYGLDGTPTGYVVYEVEGSNLKWHYKGVGRSKADQLRMYLPGSDSLNADYLIVNVFNYDPQWKVYWTEDGKQMGEMEMYWGYDPLAAKLYPKGKNKKYNWLAVDQTGHLFRIKPVNTKAKLGVVVVDRFGNSYIQ